MPENYEEVYRATGQLAGESIRLFLESHGIQALAYEESAGVTYGLTLAPLGFVRILVPSDQAEEALHILRDMEEGKYIEGDEDPSSLPPNIDQPLED